MVYLLIATTLSFHLFSYSFFFPLFLFSFFFFLLSFVFHFSSFIFPFPPLSLPYFLSFPPPFFLSFHHCNSFTFPLTLFPLHSQLTGEKWKERWIAGNSTKLPQGRFDLGKGEFSVDDNESIGMQTVSYDSYYLISSKLSAPVTNKGTGKPMFFQYTFLNDQEVDCAGQYLKFIQPGSLANQSDLNSETPYSIMFGPDSCMGGMSSVMFIMRKNGTYYRSKYPLKVPNENKITHIITLGLFPNNTVLIKLDNDSTHVENLDDEFVGNDRTVLDTDAVKPADWTEEEFIKDPSYDPTKIPDFVDDPTDRRPKLWNEKKRGKWRPRRVRNVNKPRGPQMVPNPKYKGKWNPQKPNPQFVANPTRYEFEPIQYVAIDVMQLKPGTIFDNIVITDDEDVIAANVAEWAERNSYETAYRSARIQEERRLEYMKEFDNFNAKRRSDDEPELTFEEYMKRF